MAVLVGLTACVLGLDVACFTVVRWLLVVCLDLLVVCFFDCCLCSIDLVCGCLTLLLCEFAIDGGCVLVVAFVGIW